MSDHRVAVWFVNEGNDYEPMYATAMKYGDIPDGGHLITFEEETYIQRLKGIWLAISVTEYAKGIHFKHAEYVITLRRVEVKKVGK